MTASPRRPSQQAGLVVLWGGGQLSVRVATHKVRDGERVVGAVYGLLTESDAIRLVGRLSRFDDPVDTVVEVPACSGVGTRRSRRWKRDQGQSARRG